MFTNQRRPILDIAASKWVMRQKWNFHDGVARSPLSEREGTWYNAYIWYNALSILMLAFSIHYVVYISLLTVRQADRWHWAYELTSLSSPMLTERTSPSDGIARYENLTNKVCRVVNPSWRDELSITDRTQEANIATKKGSL